MKNLIKKFVLVFIFMNLALSLNMAYAVHQGGAVHTPPDKPSGVLAPLELIKKIGNEVKILPGFTPSGTEETSGTHPDTFNTKTGIATAVSPILYAIDIFRYVISGIAFLVVIVAAIKLVSVSNEEEATKQKTAMLVGVVGLIIIQLADTIVKKMFFGEQGEAFEDLGTVQFFAEESVSQIRGVVGFVQMFVGAVAVFMIVTRGFTLIYDPGDEEAIGKAKTHITYGLVGIVVILLSEVIVRGFIFPEGGTKLPKLEVGKKIIISLTNYLSGFVALFAFLSLFFAGYRYVTSGGNEEVNETVKKTLLGAVIALVLALTAFALVHTFVTLDKTVLPEGAETATNYLL